MYCTFVLSGTDGVSILLIYHDHSGFQLLVHCTYLLVDDQKRSARQTLVVQKVYLRKDIGLVSGNRSMFQLLYLAYSFKKKT